jgi:hypothetical protein
MQLGTTGNTALSLNYTLYSSPLHTHKGSQCSLVALWQRIYNSRTVAAAHVKSSSRCPIAFLPYILNHRRLSSLSGLCCYCQLRNWTLLPSSYPGRLSSRNSTNSNDSPCPFITPQYSLRRKQPLCYLEGIYTAPLRNNGSYWTVACVFVAARMFTLQLLASERLLWFHSFGFRAQVT